MQVLLGLGCPVARTYGFVSEEPCAQARPLQGNLCLTTRHCEMASQPIFPGQCLPLIARQVERLDTAAIGVEASERHYQL